MIMECTVFNLQTKTINDTETVFINKFKFYSYMQKTAMHKR